MFKYNDEDGKKRFKELTSQNTLSKCFEENDILKASEKWLKELKNILHRSFKKIRIGNRQNQNVEILKKMKTKHYLKNELDDIKSELKDGNTPTEKMKKKHELEDRIEEIELVLADSFAEKHAALIKEHFKELSNDDGKLAVIKMWKLKKKLFPPNNEVPMAMKDQKGNIISGKNSLIHLYQKTYEERLSHKPIKEGWEEIQFLKENLFEERLAACSERKSKNWKLEKL